MLKRAYLGSVCKKKLALSKGAHFIEWKVSFVTFPIELLFVIHLCESDRRGVLILSSGGKGEGEDFAFKQLMSMKF